MTRLNFYKKNVLKNIPKKESKILVLGADKLDKKLFEELGYTNVTLSNYVNNISEKKTDYLNLLMQNIKLSDNSYEYCVAHACVHHSSKPHNSILEMYRVASKGVLVMEANDCLLTRIACKFKLAEEYELSAVKANGNHGGVDNTSVPNYVYRWTEREIMKLLKSFKPNITHDVKFNYSHDIKHSNNKLIKILFKIFFQIFKKQQNLLSIYIKVPNEAS